MTSEGSMADGVAINALTDPLRGPPSNRVALNSHQRRRCDFCSWPLYLDPEDPTDVNCWRRTFNSGQIQHLYLCPMHDREMAESQKTLAPTTLEAFVQ